MKINSLLFLAGLATLASSVSAASNNHNDNEPLVLPAMVIEAPRYQPAEQRVNASLNELRRPAVMKTVVTPEFSLPKPAVISDGTLLHSGKNDNALRLAKI